MKVRSPLGEYEYAVRAVRFAGGRLEVDGSLGVWETTMVVEPSDWAAWARRAAPALLAAGALLLIARRR